MIPQRKDGSQDIETGFWVVGLDLGKRVYSRRLTDVIHPCICCKGGELHQPFVRRLITVTV